MHDTPVAGNLAQTHSQSKFQRLPLAFSIDVDAPPYGRRESNLLSA
ncbi:MAG: hypothetical protein QOJ51_6218, partial [Acidobacteriaceae bacterium]|nr:hypothetical protein [Acidobacteriaceae bacterium]